MFKTAVSVCLVLIACTDRAKQEARPDGGAQDASMHGQAAHDAGATDAAAGADAAHPARPIGAPETAADADADSG